MRISPSGPWDVGETCSSMIEIETMRACGFLSHQADGVVAELRVKGRPGERKPDNDFCGSLPVGDSL